MLDYQSSWPVQMISLGTSSNAFRKRFAAVNVPMKLSRRTVWANFSAHIVNLGTDLWSVVGALVFKRGNLEIARIPVNTGNNSFTTDGLTPTFLRLCAGSENPLVLHNSAAKALGWVTYQSEIPAQVFQHIECDSIEVYIHQVDVALTSINQIPFLFGLNVLSEPTRG